ncbi:hypothetical protein B1NLA3E_14315 [Bacillus sp. 1NLA3E]|nr:hypothetical protein B1NLA3E_14315 [Bacillus sp. 1NLA3E]
MMIMEMDIRCHFYGEKFSPKKVEQLTGFTLENKIEVGDILHKGKNKGKPSDFGNGELCPPNDIRDKEDFGLLWVAEALYKHIDVFRIYGAENIDLVIGVFYEAQCNFVFEPESLLLFGKIGIPIQVSCYES